MQVLKNIFTRCCIKQHDTVFDANNYTPLIAAAHAGQTKMVSELLKEKADVGARDQNGNTALTVAAHRGHKDIVIEILRHRELELLIPAVQEGRLLVPRARRL